MFLFFRILFLLVVRLMLNSSFERGEKWRRKNEINNSTNNNNEKNEVQRKTIGEQLQRIKRINWKTLKSFWNWNTCFRFTWYSFVSLRVKRTSAGFFPVVFVVGLLLLAGLSIQITKSHTHTRAHSRTDKNRKWRNSNGCFSSSFGSLLLFWEQSKSTKNIFSDLMVHQNWRKNHCFIAVVVVVVFSFACSGSFLHSFFSIMFSFVMRFIYIIKTHQRYHAMKNVQEKCFVEENDDFQLEEIAPHSTHVWAKRREYSQHHRV